MTGSYSSIRRSPRSGGGAESVVGNSILPDNQEDYPRIPAIVSPKIEAEHSIPQGI